MMFFLRANMKKHQQTNNFFFGSPSDFGQIVLVKLFGIAVDCHHPGAFSACSANKPEVGKGLAQILLNVRAPSNSIFAAAWMG